MILSRIFEKTLAGERITFEEGVELFERFQLLEVGQIANQLRKRIHPDPIVTYIVDRNINYTNVCSSKCKFCAYYRDSGSQDAYVLSWQELRKKIEELLKYGGNQILLQGGLHPELNLEFLENMIVSIKKHFPQVHIHGFSPPEIIFYARRSGATLIEALQRLKSAGLGTIPGGGAEILDDEVRRYISPNKCSTSEWLEVMKTAHKLGIKTTATMVFGHIETVQHRVKHLFLLRELQDETSGFTAFIPWTFQPKNTQLGGRSVGGYEYLKTLAISRIILDNFKNIQASWVTQGRKIAQLALVFGANDLGSTMIEENVLKAAGISYKMKSKDLTDLIKDAGFIPRKRNVYYEIMSD
jgi:cyclic dehypoxanthinyl futalosine synthase